MASNNRTYISVQTFVVVLFLLVAGLIPFLVQGENRLYDKVIVASLGLGFLASLAAVFVLTLKVHRLRQGPQKPEKKQKAKAPASRPAPAATPATTTSPVSPKDLLDPGLVYRFRLGKDKSLESQSKRVIVGKHEGQIKTHSTEIIENHLEIEFRIRQDPDRDIYDTEKTLIQKYSIDLRRAGKALIYFPDQDDKQFKEMNSRQRILIQPDPDPEGDPFYASIASGKPLRIQIGDRVRHDGKFVSGYFEFHLFTKFVEVEAGDYRRMDQDFFFRLYRIFPGYDTSHPAADGSYPMIDPFLSRAEG
ncbi:MAG: hypothetical protein KDK33_10760 [Leptospiraceae bacterium]|nr:hypothetical protein [Leptospiraceae bacterium]